jgi:hypothetical protein
MLSRLDARRQRRRFPPLVRACAGIVGEFKAGAAFHVKRLPRRWLRRRRAMVDGSGRHAAQHFSLGRERVVTHDYQRRRRMRGGQKPRGISGCCADGGRSLCRRTIENENKTSAPLVGDSASDRFRPLMMITTTLFVRSGESQPMTHRACRLAAGCDGCSGRDVTAPAANAQPTGESVTVRRPRLFRRSGGRPYRGSLPQCRFTTQMGAIK